MYLLSVLLFIFIQYLLFLKIIKKILCNEILSDRKIIEIKNISIFFVYGLDIILFGFKAYVPQPHQQFTENDPFNRMNFSETATDLINDEVLSLNDICFSEECTFVLKQRPNRRHNMEWSMYNHYPVLDCNSQWQAKINVWAGLLNGHVVGPIFLYQNLNGQRFSQLLQEQIVPRLRALGMNVSLFKMYYFIK